jgi:(1->4)-alpha-D-glucan 1-alpha-D-glucosylmutase
MKDNPSVLCKELAQNWQDGRAKLYLAWKVLNLRRQYRELFLDGSFLPMQVSGKRAKNVIAFARRKGTKWTLTIVPRWLGQAHAPMKWERMAEFWGDTKIMLPATSPSRWENVLSSDVVVRASGPESCSVRVEQALGNFPVACLSA